MSSSFLAVLSLLFLIGAIALGFFKKLNVGVVAIGLAMILGKIAGVGDIFCIWLFLRGIN